ncbi:MAG: pre-peptidase C-terminal domain-containing protein, partial [Verrucomicrobia bacterium]|nr:pre-peptidase C-terminal domain-containing protein [Verrucomicrobiota bacterium]
MKTTDTCFRGRRRVCAGQSLSLAGSRALWLATLITSALVCAAWAADDHGDSPATATVVTPGSSIDGNIESAGDEDYFRIDLMQNGMLIVYTTGGTDTYGSLLDSSGDELATDDDSGEDRNFLIERRVTAGTYYVRVRHYSSADRGMYLLKVYFSPVQFVGQWRRGPAWSVAVSGDYAYVASLSAGLQVIDVSDPAHPVRVGSCETSDDAVGVAVSGHYAYVAEEWWDEFDGSRGRLEVIDVSDPANPVRFGVCETGYRAQGVVVSGHYAYVVER